MPELNDKQLNRISEFLANFSILILASLVIPNMVGIDKVNILQIVLGLTVSAGTLTGSLILLKEKQQ